MVVRSKASLFALWLMAAVLTPVAAHADLEFAEIFAGSCANAEGLIADGGFTVLGCSGPTLFVDPSLPAPIIGAGLGSIGICNSTDCDFAIGAILPGGSIVDPTMTIGMLNFCLPSFYDSSKQLCVSNISLAGTGDTSPLVVLQPTNVPPGSLIGLRASVALLRNADGSGGSVKSERLGVDSPISSYFLGELAEGVTAFAVIQQ
jgi:hypothetical protein